MDKEELLERYAAGERNFAGVELGGSFNKAITVSLSTTNLQGINLSGANLERVSLAFSDLSGAKMFGACLSYSCLVRILLGLIYVTPLLTGQMSEKLISLMPI